MLKPFQIRRLRESSSGYFEDVSLQPSSPHGVVRVSAADYDDIVLNYPRARLTYLDEDDGDQITVRPTPKSLSSAHKTANSLM
jgi:hypothetical protein